MAVVLSTGIHEQRLPPDDLRYTISIPSIDNKDRPLPLVAALHYGSPLPVPPFYGRGLLEGLIEPALRRLGAIIIAPDSVTGEWANPKSEANVIRLVSAVRTTYQVDETRTMLTGYSMGGMGTWYIAARNQDQFTAAIPIAGRPQSDTASFDWRVPLYVIHSRDDEVVPLAPTKAVAAELRRRGADVTLTVVGGITHYAVGSFVKPLRDAVPWLESVWARSGHSY